MNIHLDSSNTDQVLNDDIGSDSMIGCTAIDLNKAFKEGVHDSFFPITNPKGQHTGEIRLVIYFRPLVTSFSRLNLIFRHYLMGKIWLANNNMHLSQ